MRQGVLALFIEQPHPSWPCLQACLQLPKLTQSLCDVSLELQIDALINALY